MSENPDANSVQTHTDRKGERHAGGITEQTQTGHRRGKAHSSGCFSDSVESLYHAVCKAIWFHHWQQKTAGKRMSDRSSSSYEICTFSTTPA